MPHLLIKLTKRSDGGYVLACERPDGTVTWQKNQGGHAAFFPVHDLTHYAVETELRHRRGFYGLVADGWDLTDFGAPWPKGRFPADLDPSELIVGLLDADRSGSGGRPVTAAELNRSAGLFLEQRGVGNTAAGELVRVTDEQLSRIRARLGNLRDRWEALEPGETLELPFHLD